MVCATHTDWRKEVNLVRGVGTGLRLWFTEFSLFDASSAGPLCGGQEEAGVHELLLIVPDTQAFAFQQVAAWALKVMSNLPDLYCLRQLHPGLQAPHASCSGGLTIGHLLQFPL